MVELTVMDALVVLLYVAIAFVPPIVYLWWVRNQERREREPWRNLGKVFLWGAVGGIVIALILESLIGTRPDAVPLGLRQTVFMAVIVAPFVEELAKGLGVPLAGDARPEPEDGLVYGAAAGFGFAATENLLYMAGAIATGSFGAFVLTVAIRSVAAALLHGSASALVGHGYWRLRYGDGGVGGLVGFYLLAVVLHGFYNFVASAYALLGLIVAIVLALAVFRFLLQKVYRLDRKARRVGA